MGHVVPWVLLGQPGLLVKLELMVMLEMLERQGILVSKDLRVRLVLLEQ